ncbi:MAG: hypothetical protein LBT51_08020 [Fusobacteriaceae bacterium]|jgi:hypothetical protein|nr:hypothetical protein [Fusobacteriaceae bacterium]
MEYKKKYPKKHKLKNKPNEYKWNIKKAYELGENLIDLAIKYKLNYSTLRNIASKDGWIKGRIKTIVLAKETLESIDKVIENREAVKKEYAAATATIRSRATSGLQAKCVEEAWALRAKGLKDIYAIDKEIHNITTDKEYVEYKKAYIEYEQLRAVVEQDDNDSNIAISDKDLPD